MNLYPGIEYAARGAWRAWEREGAGVEDKPDYWDYIRQKGRELAEAEEREVDNGKGTI